MRTVVNNYRAVIWGLVFILAISSQVLNAQVTVTIPSTTILPSSTASIPVNVGTLTGLNVTAFEFVITCDTNIVKFTGATSAGSVSEGWSVVYNASAGLYGPGKMKVVAANATPIVGGGVLIYLNVLTKSAPGRSSLAVSNFLFNTGTPAAALTVGSITVSTNRPPTFVTKMRDTTINENQAFTFTYSATDPDAGTTVTYKLESGPTGSTLTGGVFSWTPGTGKAGVYDVIVSASDGQAADTAKAKITVVKPVNTRPSFVQKLPNQTINAGTTLTFAYTASDPDAGAVLTYSLLNPPSGASITSAGAFTFTPPGNPDASYLIVAVVSDGSLADTAKTTITVNRYPAFVNKMPDQTINAGDPVSFTYSATDPDGTTLTYKLESGPSGATLTGTNFSWTSTAGLSGVFRVVVSVSDGQLADTAKANITVVAQNRAPSFVQKLSSQTMNEGSTLSFTYTASDPDAGTTLTFSLVNAPTGATMSTAGVFTFTPPANPAASYSIVAVVSDGSLTDTAKATVTVNRKPVFGSRTPANVTTISRNVSTTFTVTATDPDGNTLTYTWKVNGTTEKTGDNTFTRTFSDAHNTPKTVTATFADPGGLEGSTTWNFTITPVEEMAEMPTDFALGQNYPNPFNPATTLRFDLPKESTVALEVYNVLGLRVRTLVPGVTMSAGKHQIRWDGRDDQNVAMPSGIYLYRIKAGDFQATKRMTLLK